MLLKTNARNEFYDNFYIRKHRFSYFDKIKFFDFLSYFTCTTLRRYTSLPTAFGWKPIFTYHATTSTTTTTHTNTHFPTMRQKLVIIVGDEWTQKRQCSGFRKICCCCGKSEELNEIGGLKRVNINNNRG